ncbi:MAG: cytochrome c-type biosis protein CcmE [Thermoleophilaceae bacterium]|nr:cytochrome c-type biosis protein CcmE [Thermoleophilaceae bacterium]
MAPSKKRKIRLVVALTTAVLLAGALLYTSFGSATAAVSPSQLLASGGGGSYELTGKVVDGSIRKQPGDGILFRVRDRTGTRSVPVTYHGLVSDTFRQGREVIVKGSLQNGVFEGQRDTLTTKCPSKFANKKSGSTL